MKRYPPYPGCSLALWIFAAILLWAAVIVLVWDLTR